MIGWIKGEIIDIWHKGLKKFVLISCNSIGYEIQLLPRDLDLLKEKIKISLWIHQIYKENEIILFGFHEKLERNLFRKIIEVNGIGPQIAISLLEEYKFYELVFAIKDRDYGKLTNVSGIGKRIAERLIVELNDKLNEFEEQIIKNEKSGHKLEKDNIHYKQKEELKTILKDLNYEYSEINKVVSKIYQKRPLSDQSIEDIDSYLKEALVLLSQDLATKGT